MPSEQIVHERRRLGRLPAKASRKALLFSDFFRFVDVPSEATYWELQPQLPLRSFGNLQYGCCTRAKQAVAAMRMELLECGEAPMIEDGEIIRVYQEMSDRRYGGGDNGAYEEDALADWRNPDLTFRSASGHPYTIDAFLRLDPKNQLELRAALALAGAKGIAVCLNLPAAYAHYPAGQTWDTPKDGRFIGDWEPGSWGGHSMWLHGMREIGPRADSTWEEPPYFITWDAMAAYCDEAHLVIDSADTWMQEASGAGNEPLRSAIGDVVDAVNVVSGIRIKLS